MRALLPEAVAEELLTRWSEPHRHYHSVSHLTAGLEALELLGGGPLERVAFWFHDAVHSNSTPADEQASAGLAERLLKGHLPDAAVAEVHRLIMLTAGHHVAEGDLAGARVCDADLSGMGGDWEDYLVNVAGIRAELPGLTDVQWRQGRSAFLATFLEREHLFHTPSGRERWEAGARRNMSRELAGLRPS